MSAKKKQRPLRPNEARIGSRIVNVDKALAKLTEELSRCERITAEDLAVTITKQP